MSRRPRHLVPLAAFVLVVGNLGSAGPARAAATLNVPADYSTIQAAINAAAPGDTVLVANGTYHELFTIPTNIVVQSAHGAASAILDGGSLGTVVNIQAGTIRGFTIQHGGGGGTDGGGLIVQGAAVVENNSIVDNTACGSGAAMVLHDGPTIRNNYIARNGQSGCSGGPGGAIGVVGSSTATIVGNTFEANTFPAGAVSLWGSGSPTIDRNVFRNNLAGGITMYNDSTPLVSNNLFVGNTGVNGSAINWLTPSGSNGPTVVNNTIVLTSGTDAPAIFAGGFDSNASITNNVISGSSSAGLLNCDSSYSALPPQVSFNDIRNASGPAASGVCAGVVGTSGNQSVDPGFVDPALANYHLRANSLLIDAGTNTGAPGLDIDGDARPFDGDENGTATVDIGYDESTDPVLVTPPHLSFGNLPVGDTSAPMTVTLKNLGPGPLTFSAAAIAGTNNLNFAITSQQTCTSSPVAVGGTCTVGVTFKPNAMGLRSAELDVTRSGPTKTTRIPLNGTGVDPVQVTPASLVFGPFTVGNKSAPKSVTVKYIGHSSATVTTVSVGGQNAADFVITGQTCVKVPLSNNATCTVSIQFGPRAVGGRGAILTIAGPAPVGTRHVALTGTGNPPPSGVSWGSNYAAGPASTWNYGGSLGRTTHSGVQRLHLAYNTARIGSTWATDSGPYVGAYYIQSASGATWSTPFRLNNSSSHATTVGLAAAGSHIYAIFTTSTSWQNYSVTAPRGLFVRVNTNYGSSTAWKGGIRLSPVSGRAGFPTITAAGTDAYVAWTNGDTGAIELSVSHDSGATWKTTAIGTTSQNYSDGYNADPTVAVAGSTVAVTWVSDVNGTVAVRVSGDRGVSWNTTTTLGQTLGTASVAVRGTRIAVAWTTPTDVRVRQRVSGVWGPTWIVAQVPNGSSDIPYSAAVVLQDPNRIGVAWGEATSSTNGILRWVESSNGGSLWYAPQTIFAGTAARTRNDWPSVVWPSASTRQVAWNGWTPNTTNYRQYFIIGTGAPTGPTIQAVVVPGSVGAASTGRSGRVDRAFERQSTGKRLD